MTAKLSLSCTIVTILSFLIIENILFGIVSSTSTTEEIIEDLPKINDLDKYLRSLEKIVHFANSNRHSVDLYVQIGLLFTDVNLRNTLQVREHGLPVQSRFHLENLLKVNVEIKKYFLKMVDQYYLNLDAEKVPPVMLVNLLTNTTTWPNHLKKFTLDLLKKTKFHTNKELEALYFKWPVYNDILHSYYNHSYKDLGDSGLCWGALARNPNNYKPTLIHCKVPYECVKMAVNGTHFGKAMADRIMFLIMAQFGRACVLLSQSEDKDLLDSLCAMAYNEIEFMAYHGFETTALMMEIMTLCSLEGHAQFLRRSWIDEALDFQTTLGCFNLTRPAIENVIREDSTTKSPVWQFVSTEVTIMDGSCNAMSTAVAAGMLSAAIRYILESFY